MSENKKLTPKIRFKGFTEDWEQRKLNQFSKYITSNKTVSDIVSDGIYDLYDANSIIGKINKNVIKEEYITIIKDGSGVGKVRRLPKNTLFIGTMGGILSMNSNIDFIYCNLLRTDFTKEINGATIPHIYYSSYGNNEYYIPKIEEQNKIGMIFNNIDNLITLHQRKYDKLVKIKSSLLEKMFPKNSSKIPEVRFKGFTEDWEQRKFGEELETITDYVAAGSFADLAANVKYLSNPSYAQLVRTVDIKNNFTSKDNVYVDKNAFNYLWRVNLKDECIIMPNIGNCGEIYFLNQGKLKYKNNVLGPNAILVRSKKNDNKFLSFDFQTKEFQDRLKLIISPNGQTKFNKTELKTIDLIVPNKDEQLKIGKTFSQIDNLITLHQRKLDKLQNIKKSLLDKMFV